MTFDDLAPKNAQEAEISVGIAFKDMNVQRYVLVAAQCLQLLHGHPEVDRVRQCCTNNKRAPGGLLFRQCQFEHAFYLRGASLNR